MQETDKKQEATYNIVSHVIDKAIINFLVGTGLALCLVGSIVLVFMKFNKMSICPVILYFLMACGFFYAFGFLGTVCATTKEASYKVGAFSAVASSTVSSFAFLFPVFFLQLVIKFLMIFIPAYSLKLKHFVPRIKTLSLHLKNTCEPETFCIFTGSFGKMAGMVVDTLLLFVGLAVIFSIINSITGVIKVLGGTKSS